VTSNSESMGRFDTFEEGIMFDSIVQLNFGEEGLSKLN
jgi:hypothetical protein